MVRSAIKAAETLDSQEAKVCNLGTCKMEDTYSPQSDNFQDFSKLSKVWLEVTFVARQRRKSKRAVITGLQASLGSGVSLQCATTLILYAPPQSERMKFLSLEPMILPEASSAGVLDRAHYSQDSAKDPHLQRKLEALIRLDPMRHQEITFAYPLNRSPGEGFRRAVEMVRASVAIK